MEGLEGQIKQKETQIAKREEELTVLEAKAKQAKVIFETRARRGPVPGTSAGRIIVIDPLADEVLFERESDKKGAIASTTKVMTALIIIETGDLDKMVTIEDADTKCAPVRIGLKAGEQYTRRNLLTALMVKSSNDIAQALARDNAGSLESFKAKMNARAKELGCENTHFINPNGLPPVDGQEDPFSTARDLAKIAAIADKLPDLRVMVKLPKYDFVKPDGKIVALENTNHVLRSCEFCDGMKTGYTEAAGYCLVCTGERNGKRRIVVVLNGTHDGVWKDAENLLEWSLKI
jgi:D-alanyl-D-alanine carboxypeptidase (penicillin-binding protein 5/6)